MPSKFPFYDDIKQITSKEIEEARATATKFLSGRKVLFEPVSYAIHLMQDVNEWCKIYKDVPVPVLPFMEYTNNPNITICYGFLLGRPQAHYLEYMPSNMPIIWRGRVPTPLEIIKHRIIVYETNL